MSDRSSERYSELGVMLVKAGEPELSQRHTHTAVWNPALLKMSLSAPSSPLPYLLFMLFVAFSSNAQAFLC